MSPSEPERLRAPSLLLAPLRELRALREPFRRLSARRRLAALPRGDGGAVMVLPGMHVGDWTTAPMRRFLRRLGHDARGWELGFHRSDVAATLPKAMARLEAIAAESGRPVALVGWSLGGVVARELARLRPDLVRAVVTLGAPVVGGVRYVAVSYPWRRKGYDLAAIETLASEAERVPIRVPVTAIWSRRDGIVCGAACVDRTTPGAVEVEVGSSHWGLGFDPDALAALARALAVDSSAVATDAPKAGGQMRERAQSQPDFSPLAAGYARSRPLYPAELFAFLAALVARHELAWDCATGNGQAALGLAARFERVVATDLSAEQIRHALAHPRIDYRVASAEASGLEAGSVDVVTVGAAAHWFEPAAFAREVRRVVLPGGVLAAFTYHVGIVEPPFAEPFRALYWELLKPYFAAETRLVDERYETLELPGTPIAAPRFEVSATWTLDEALAFVRTWSGAAEYRKQTGDDPGERIRPALAGHWGPSGEVRTLRWPLFLRAQRL